jgi:uroporphyrinogen-III decarboxylase
MDPSMLYAPPARIEEEVATILAGFGQGEGHGIRSAAKSIWLISYW